MASKIPIPQICLQQCRLEPAAETKVSILVDSVFFFLHHVLIINTNDDYRLLVIKKNRILCDKKYKNFKGARIAFKKRFAELGYKQDITPQWTHIYPPDDDWLRDLLKLAKKCKHAGK